MFKSMASSFSNFDEVCVRIDGDGRGTRVVITPSVFLIGQMLAMWPMSSFHSPHRLQPHLKLRTFLQ